MPRTSRNFFEGRTLGSAMCDGSPTNNCVEKDAGACRGGCNAHGRRGLVEAVRLGDARAVPGLELYAKIFHVDAVSKTLGESLEQRLERRLREAAPMLLEKLRKIEALHAGTNVDGEREAARRAAERIRARLAELRAREQDDELFYSLPDPWKRKLFVALCPRYGLSPYRERGRRYSTVIVRAPKAFQHGTLWPEFSRPVRGAPRTPQ